MRKVFISYSRQNKRDIDQLVEHLRVLGCDTWVDSSLHGGQDWWEEILQRIAHCETFIAIISREALSSTACKREFDWAEALGKPVLPVAVEPQPSALPRRFSIRQIVDYSEPEDRDRAALMLAGGLTTLPAAPPLPDPLPKPPAAPLSYLTDLIELVSQPDALDRDQQRHILSQLEPALRSVDGEERRGGRDILELLSSRDDLYADVDRTIIRLRSVGDGPASVRSDDQGTMQGRSDAPTSGSPATTEDRRTAGGQPTDTTPTPPVVPFVQRLNRRTKIVLAVVAAFAAVATAIVISISATKQSSSGGGVAASTTKFSASHTPPTIPEEPGTVEWRLPGGLIPAIPPGPALQELLRKVPNADECTPYPSVYPGATATVECSPSPGPGVDAVSSVHDELYPNQKTLDQSFDIDAGFAPQPCPSMGQSPQNWHNAANPQQTQGKVMCRVDGRAPSMRWTNDSKLLIGTATGQQGGTIDQVYQWWKNLNEV